MVYVHLCHLFTHFCNRLPVSRSPVLRGHPEAIKRTGGIGVAFLFLPLDLDSGMAWNGMEWLCLKIWGGDETYIFRPQTQFVVNVYQVEVLWVSHKKIRSVGMTWFYCVSCLSRILDQNNPDGEEVFWQRDVLCLEKEADIVQPCTAHCPSKEKALKPSSPSTTTTSLKPRRTACLCSRWSVAKSLRATVVPWITAEFPEGCHFHVPFISNGKQLLPHLQWLST